VGCDLRVIAGREENEAPEERRIILVRQKTVVAGALGEYVHVVSPLHF
jgi:hypothetical protein